MAKDVTILTGFLGAGKTTFLNALLGDRPQTRFALIENEFGEEGIDGGLVVRPDVDLVELSNGCLCCSLSNDLLDVLEALNDRRDSFDELIIETTGIADPASVAVPFLMLPRVLRDFHLKRVICLVDAELIEDQLRDTEEAIGQISFSDIILINKTDRVSNTYLNSLQDLLRGLNPFAHVLLGHKDNYPIRELMALERDTAGTASVATLRPVPAQPGLSPVQATTQPHSIVPFPSKHHHHAHSDLVSLSFRFAEPIDLTQIYHRLTTLLLFDGKDLYRIKGIIADPTRKERWIVQSVGRTLTLTEGADWQPGEPRITRIVFIGKRLKPAGFEKLLRHCFAKDPQKPVSRLPPTPNL
ncbi:CobW family GTP-binding protein [Larkinella punicea]|uniref:GTP-binding protein n=1 Tax=Larkinella punicea TaxID=2315727 RepID=A0A368JFV4_9BACT|nr:GTP-binding protein [Larkinella punicea]RCR65564.1 GTP-binding protein [Larkinella punicea]